MALKEVLQARANAIFNDAWSVTPGTAVPHAGSQALTLKGNTGVEIDAAVLYADMADSTDMVRRLSAQHAAEVYQAFLYCAGRIIEAEGGTITAYDGDRVMAVYMGTQKRTQAARTALKINWAVRHIVQLQHDAVYAGRAAYTLRSHVGIDRSTLLASRAGVRGASDLVWVGRAANYAAKLASRNKFATYVTEDVYQNMDRSLRINGTPAQNMWTKCADDLNGVTIYGSNWTWGV